MCFVVMILLYILISIITFFFHLFPGLFQLSRIFSTLFKYSVSILTLNINQSIKN